MAKYKFKPKQRFALWKAWGQKCALDGEPIQRWDNLAIDHIIPEDLLGRPDELQKVLKDYGLSPEFNINSYENCIPVHPNCNRQKSDKKYDKTTCLHLINLARSKMKKVLAIDKKYDKNIDESEIIAKFQSLVERKGPNFLKEVIPNAFIIPLAVEFVKKLVGKLEETISDELGEKLKSALKKITWFKEDGDLLSDTEIIAQLAEIVSSIANISKNDAISTSKIIIEEYSTGELLKNLLNIAQKQVRMVFYSFSWNGFFTLLEKNMIPKAKNNVKFKILTDSNVKFQQINEFLNLINKENCVDSFEIRLIEGSLHLNELITDQVVALNWSGSINAPAFSPERRMLFRGNTELRLIQSLISIFEESFSTARRVS